VDAAESPPERLQRDGGVPAVAEIAISVANTFEPGAFDENGIYDNSSDRLFRLIGAYLAPGEPPPTLPPKK
jgi:hypothetical protein